MSNSDLDLLSLSGQKGREKGRYELMVSHLFSEIGSCFVAQTGLKSLCSPGWPLVHGVAPKWWDYMHAPPRLAPFAFFWMK